MKILHIDSSTNGSDSVSRELTAAIIEHLREKNPDAEVTYLDLEASPLAHIDEVSTGAIRKPVEDQTDAMRAAAPAERAVLEQFLAHDTIVVGAPMYNFTVPSTLSAWMDRLGVPRVTFRYGENGAEGLVKGKRVIIASARGGQYDFDALAENQESLLKAFFGFIGVEDLHFIRAEKTNSGDRDEQIAKAKREIEKL